MKHVTVSGVRGPGGSNNESAFGLGFEELALPLAPPANCGLSDQPSSNLGCLAFYKQRGSPPPRPPLRRVSLPNIPLLNSELHDSSKSTNSRSIHLSSQSSITSKMPPKKAAAATATTKKSAAAAPAHGSYRGQCCPAINHHALL